MRTSLPTHPGGCCCQVYKGIASPQTPHKMFYGHCVAVLNRQSNLHEKPEHYRSEDAVSCKNRHHHPSPTEKQEVGGSGENGQHSHDVLVLMSTERSPWQHQDHKHVRQQQQCLGWCPFLPKENVIHENIAVVFQLLSISAAGNAYYMDRSAWTSYLLLYCDCRLNLIIIIIIIIISAFKGAIQDFSQSPHSAANCFQHVSSSGQGTIVYKLCATHRALITCKSHMLRATWYKGTAQLLSLTEFNHIYFSFSLLAEPLNR